jgi:PAS domain S-box-containing protein
VAGRPFWETQWWTVSPEVQQRLREAVAQAAGGGVVRYEVDNIGAGGNIVTVDFSIKPLWDEEGKVRFLIAEGRDISERKRAEADLDRSQARYKAIVEDQTELISRFSPDLKLNFVNCAYCRYFGELKEEILGKEFRHHVPEDDLARLRLHIERLDRENPVATIEHRVLTGKGELRWLKWTDRAIFNDNGSIVEYQAVGRDITDRKQAEEFLRESERELRLLSSQLLTAQEDERKRIARELHDSTGQSLSAVKFGVERALAQIVRGDMPEGVKALEDLVPTVQYSIDELRRIMRDLRPSILDDLGLLVTLNWFCRDFQKIYTSIQVQKTIDIMEEEIPEPLKIVLFRVVQEALNNIAKHSSASSVILSLQRGPAGIELAIDDDGIGFSMEVPAPGEKTRISFGLSSMRERVDASGGTFDIRSIRGEGTCIRAGWPCIFKSYRLAADS